MTPKEKAKELVDKFLNQDINFPYIDSEDGQCIGAGYMTYNSAKQCALISVEMILETLDKNLDSSQFAVMNYWNDIKEEIQKF